MSKRKSNRARMDKNNNVLIPGATIKEISRDAGKGTRNLFRGIREGLFFPYRGVKERRE